MASTSNVLLFRRLKNTSTNKPTVIETNLPGHFVEDEFSEDYPSYLLSNSDPVIEGKQHSEGSSRISKNWLELAKKHKEKGNSLFRITDKYAEAEREYRRALHCLRRAERSQAGVDELRVLLYVNMTACDLGQGDYADARKHASKAIKLDPVNVKALYRRSQARRYAGFDLDGAEADLKAALAIVPDDAVFNKALDQLRKDRAKSANEESQVAKRMFKKPS